MNYLLKPARSLPSVMYNYLAAELVDDPATATIIAGNGMPSDTIYLQEQNYSLAALAKRDAKEDPFGSEPKSSTLVDVSTEDPEKSLMKLALMVRKELLGADDAVE